MTHIKTTHVGSIPRNDRLKKLEALRGGADIAGARL
jgi:hypothetical protein